MVEGSDAECHLCHVSIMLSVANKPIMLSVIRLIVVASSAAYSCIMSYTLDLA
jgi:hypothetical protein